MECVARGAGWTGRLTTGGVYDVLRALGQYHREGYGSLGVEELGVAMVAVQRAAGRLGKLGSGVAEVRGKEAVLQGERLGGRRNGHGRVQLLGRGLQPSFWTRRWWRSQANSEIGRAWCRERVCQYG